MTKSEAIAEHRKMWNWIADETENQQRKVKKEEYFNSHDVNGGIDKCFCCLYAGDLAESEDKSYDTMRCYYCPLDWDSTTRLFQCLDKTEEYMFDGLYSEWIDAKDWQKVARIARKIANLPERALPGEDVKEQSKTVLRG